MLNYPSILIEAQIDAVIAYTVRYAQETRDRSAVSEIGSLWDEDVDMREPADAWLDRMVS